MSGSALAMSAASAMAAGINSSAATTRLMRPHWHAVCASRKLPVSDSSLARLIPIVRDSFCDSPQPGIIPTLAWVSANRAFSDPINTSQAKASSNPPVIATPLIAPTTGLRHCSTALTGLAAGWLALAAPSPSLPNSSRSSPAVNARVPAPVSTTARTRSSRSSAIIASASAARKSRDSAFIADGRLSVTSATGPWRSTVTVCSVLTSSSARFVRRRSG